MSDELSPILKKASEEMEVVLSAEKINMFRRYADMLVEKNKVMNLTNIDDDEGIAMRHFIDSLTLTPYISEEMKRKGRKDLSLIDVGTGAGFPGIPVKISMPDIKLTLMDSLNKRLRFLGEVVDGLGLSGVSLIHSRAEDAGSSKRYREKYDIATARAVADLQVLSEYCLPFVSVGGVFIAMKGHCSEELGRSSRAITLLGGTIEKTDEFYLPGTDIGRTVIVIRKIRPTPPSYPRKAGTPSKDPI